MEHTNLAGRAGRLSAAHWKTATVGWIAFGIVAVALGTVAGKVVLTDAETASGETAKAERILQSADFRTPATESVLVQSATATVADPAFASAVAGVVQTVARLPNVTNIQNPLDPRQGGLVSKDRRSALVQFDIKGKAADAADKVQPMLDAIDRVQAGNPSFRIEEFGEASANHIMDNAFNQDLQRAEYTSLPLTLLILLLAFGALVAAGLPVLLAFTAVLTATGLNTLLSHVIHTSDATTSVILMIGLAVGVDYSLFYLKREREERAAGRTPHDALLRTASTSGQAVLISGATVLVAMAGLLLSGNAIFTTIGIGTMIVVAAAMVASLTVLPALMHRLGDKVNAGRIPFFGGRPGEERFWNAVVGRVLARPAISLAAAVALLVALALPALSLHTKLPSFTDLPHSLKIVRTYERMQAAFPGAQTPAELIVKAPNVTSPQYQAAYRQFRARALATGLLYRPFHVFVDRSRTVARVEFSIAGSGDDKTSLHALDVLRRQVIPPVAATLPDAQYAVTGITAGTHDFNSQMKARLPFVFAFVLGLAFVLLLLTFRSVVIPAKAVVLNLLSVGAAYGILVLVFQHSWAEGIFGFRSNHSIASWLPLFLFVVLFGLSMDYHVFILSRVKELHDHGETTPEAVRHAITRTAGTVTSAALIMVGVFGLFATVREIDIKQMGVGLAVAVLIDATIVRAVLLPAAMALLDEWNWYLPRWLEWLPELNPEQEERPESPALVD
jgi:RND superfamily putative drug exporter